MHDSGFSRILTPLAPGTATSGDDVVYRSAGSLLVISDGSIDAARVLEQPLPAGTVLVSAQPAEAGANGRNDRVRILHARVSRLKGWLGRFRPDFVRSGIPVSAPLDAPGDGTFDLVIDLSSQPLIKRSVRPIGYFAPRDAEALAAALEQCRYLVGEFAKPRYFEYQLGLCAHSSFGQPGCTRCLDVCGADAIRSMGDRIQVEPNLCQGCAACTLACPTGALSFTGPTRETLLEQVEQAIAAAGRPNPVVIIHSPDVKLPAFEPGNCVGLAVAPLAAFGEELWLATLARGAGRLVLLTDDDLPQETRRLLEARLEIARTMLVASGHPADAISLVDRLEDASVETEAGRVTRRGQDESADSPGLVVHHKRGLLTRSLARLEPAEGFEPETLEAGAPFGTLVVDPQRCTLCSACVKICPTAALDYNDTGDSGLARLTFAEELCVQCGACEQGCPENAIGLQARIAPLPVRGFWRALASDALASCLDCGQGFMPEKLLAAGIRRAEATKMPAAAVEQMKRCPDCRHRRLQGNN
ncbi:MAG: 4Fe-4S binding protein [Xanthomonadaceae bacterium]|nr:4Fe-4S binding protein [Xanthomonadaceae bacterium]